MLIYYILIASSSVIVVKFTESDGGKLDYNVPTAVLGSELTKLGLALVLDRVWFDSKGTAIPTTTWSSYLRYAVPSVIYAFANNLLVIGISLLGPSLYSLFGNFKIVSTTLLTSLVLSKNFTRIQWIAVVLLMLSFFVAKVDLLMSDTDGNCGRGHSHRMLSASEQRSGLPE